MHVVVVVVTGVVRHRRTSQMLLITVWPSAIARSATSMVRDSRVKMGSM
jgi:hypothetical protein